MSEGATGQLKAFSKRESTITNVLKSSVMVHFGDKVINTIALWDTGATNSCISLDVVKQLGLISTGKLPIRTPTGDGVVNTYLVDVTLPNNVPVKDLMVCDSAIGSQGIGMLIGMDIISQGDFCVTNFNGHTVFSFRMPSYEVLDFVTGIRFRNRMGSKGHGPGKRKRK